MTRNSKIDNLRCIGTLLIVLAHVNPPHYLAEARSFDVVLLAILSGYSVAYSKNKEYSKYLVGRIKKLVFPAYICMAIVFGGSYLACTLIGKTQLYDGRTILASVFFSDQGMGYIWIVKVYLIMAVFAHILLRINDVMKSDKWAVIFVLVLITAQFGILQTPLTKCEIFNDYFAYILPYVALEFIGIRTNKGTTRFKYSIGVISGMIFLTGTLLIRDFCPTSYKFPPNWYYIAYGVFASIVLLIVIPNKKIQIAEYVSKYSFDIYLIHIIVLLAYNMMASLVKMNIFANWFFEYLIVLSVSLIGTLALNKIRNVRRKEK